MLQPKSSKVLIFPLLKNSLLFACFIFLISYPNLYYFSIKVFYSKIEQRVGIANTSHFFLQQSLTLLFLLFLCSLCGFAFYKRNGLPGLGNFKKIRENGIKIFFPLALILSLFSFLFFDQFFMEKAPQYFPKSILWALAIPFSMAFLEETIFRFGMLTVLVGGIKRWLSPLWANIAVSLFYALVMTRKTFGLADIAIEWNYIGLTAVAGSFFTCFLLGYIFIKYGLKTSIFFHFLLRLKYPIYALIF